MEKVIDILNKVEILAPSGDWDSFCTAINNGADAVYLGLGDFNARAKSTYFTKENIRETVEYAHLRGVKVYVTINTLVAEEEYSAFISLVESCVKAKVDAYIVQDYGCAKVLKQLFPNLVIHASTQMGIHNVIGAEMAKKMGFTRVVLSRETKMEDILAIANTGIEVEYFIQGALCVAFSGNCYFSEFNQGQSGNRGKCLQLCRLPYEAYLKETKIGEGYLLSARDLCMIERLEELISAGVISFKIEGRLRRAGYVGQAVKSYRTAIDSLKNFAPIKKEEEKRKLRQVFSRGDFNYSAYLEAGVPNNVINPKNQNHLGLEIGRVVSVEKFKDLNRVGIKSNHDIKSGDGLKFLDYAGVEVDSLGVGNVESNRGLYYIYTKHKITKDLIVYLTLDSKMEAEVIAFKQKVAVNLELEAKENEPIKIFAYSNNKKAVTKYVSEYICTTAKTAPTSQAEIESIFGSLDQEVFEVKLNKIDLGNVFIPKSALKEARRLVAPALKEAIIEAYERDLPEVSKVAELADLSPTRNLKSKFNNIIVVNENSNFCEAEISENDLIIYAPCVYDSANITKNWRNIQGQFRNIGLALPTIASGKDCTKLDEIVYSLPKGTPLLIENAYGLKYTNDYYVIAGTDMNVYSKFTVEALLNLGVSEIVWSKEREAQDPEAFEWAQGQMELMHFCHCPYKTIFGGGCEACKFGPELTLVDQAGKPYAIRRTRISQCYFTLSTQKEIIKNKKKKFIDLRK